MPFLSASGVSPYNKIRVGSGGGVELPFAFGNALEFDGVNDYVSLGSGAAILSTAFEWTISLWIKPSKTGVSLGGDNSSANDLLYLINSTLFRVQFAGGSAALSRLNFTIPPVTLNQWHHVCITKDSSNDVRLYWDGVESVTRELPTNDTINMYQLGSYRRVGLWFDGVMDEFGLDITTAASSSQVSDLYNGGNGASFLKVMPSARVNYHFNEVSGSSVAVDATTNGNDGTLNNFNTSTCWVSHGLAFGNALQFDGVNDHLSDSNDNTLYDTSNYFTISFWFYLQGDISTFLHFINLKSTIGQSMVIGTANSSRGLYSGITVNFGSNSIGFGPTTQPTANQWNHVAITGLKTNSGSTGFICNLNGVPLSNRGAGGYGAMPNTTRIGYASNNNYKSPVILDEIAYYDNHQATPSELSAFYNSGSGTLATDVIASPKFYLRLDESSPDSIAVDSSGNDINFALNNFDTSTCWVAH